MQSGQIKRFFFVVPVLVLIFFYYIASSQKKIKQICLETSGRAVTGQSAQLQLAVTAIKGDTNPRWFGLGTPVSVSKEVGFRGLTVVGTSGRLESAANVPPLLRDIPVEKLNGIVYLIDLSMLPSDRGSAVLPVHIQEKLEANSLPVSMVAFKTNVSSRSRDNDLVGQYLLRPAPEAGQLLHDIEGLEIGCLILDVPLFDSLAGDMGRKAAQNFYGLSGSGSKAEDEAMNETVQRLIIDSAWFGNLKEGYYYAMVSPSRFGENRVATGLLFYPMTEIK